jgi:hypothetical protein
MAPRSAAKAPNWKEHTTKANAASAGIARRTLIATQRAG